MIVKSAPQPKSKPRVYNLCWYQTAAGTKVNPAKGARGDTFTISDQNRTKVVILYPALATPEILVGDTDKLELLLLTQKAEDLTLLRFRILLQLKVAVGFDYEKKCANRALFVDATGNLIGTEKDRKIDIEEIPFGAKDLLTTASSRFFGYVDKRAHALYDAHGYRTLYRVSMSSKVLEAATGSDLKARPEPQDLVINDLLKKRSSWAIDKEDGGYYSFVIGSEEVDHTKFDKSNPIQSYHPVYHYGDQDLVYANLAHHSDVHLSARQQVMRKTVARVIDYWDMGNDTIGLKSSPQIGPMVNSCSHAMMEILEKLGKSPTDILLIGGDLVDFLKSLYPTAAIAKSVEHGLPHDVWKAVELDDDYEKRYLDGVDMVAFYGILLGFCRAQSMPVYAVTGNHDCYWKPYGISPRIDAEVYEKRANEGIPSDHNLTFYEAILAFGETYKELKSGLNSPFTEDMFDWFYTVFTPFCDFDVELVKQHLTVLGWGDNEDLFDIPYTGQGFGHLPRAKDCISDNQLSLLEKTIAKADKAKNVILMTHFTFVSYDYEVPLRGGDTDAGRGDVYVSPVKNFSVHNFGTFNRNRVEVLQNHCIENRDIQVVLTGHSHRRALYLMDEVDTWGRNSIKTRHFDFNEFEHAKKTYPDKMRPAVIVSDSGGTIPRYNYDGEFNGRGSDSPSGTHVTFDQGSGDVNGVGAAYAAIKPRVVVAIDYLDIQEKETVIKTFESEEFSLKDEKSGKLTGIIFDLELHDQLATLGFWVQTLQFFVRSSYKVPWQMVNLQRLTASVKDKQKFALVDVDLKTFSKYFANERSRGIFCSMTFGTPALAALSRYDYGSPWCWELQIAVPPSPGDTKIYVVKRSRERAEKPDFDWRRDVMRSVYN